MVQAIFNVLAEIVQAFTTLLVSMFSSVVSIFYTPGTGNAAGELTIVGTLTLIALGTGLVMWAIYWIRSLIRVRRG